MYDGLGTVIDCMMAKGLLLLYDGLGLLLLYDGLGTVIDCIMAQGQGLFMASAVNKAFNANGVKVKPCMFMSCQGFVCVCVCACM